VKAKAVWWLSPSLLEPIDGPWGTIRSFGNDPVLAWREIINWAAALRVDRIITGVEPYMTDRVVGQWPFHYLCRFPSDADARCFDASAVERNIEIAREIAAYGLTRGVKILLHHYNFMAPQKWVSARPTLSEKLDQVDDRLWGKWFHPDRMGFLVGHVCWNDEDYRSFLARCWGELFENVPELSGLMVTPGEFNYCRCRACTGGGATNIFDAHDASSKIEDPRRRSSISLIEAVRDFCHAAGKQLIMRTWGMEPWAKYLPGGIEYATKFSVFDACWAGPDPAALEYSRSGHQAWMMQAIESENSGPLIWHDEAWARDAANRLNACDSLGTIVHINLHWGHSGQCASFTSSRNIQRLLEYLEPRASIPSAPIGGVTRSQGEFQHFFGRETGDAIYEAARLIAAVPLNMTSILHLQREGFTFHLQPWFDGRWRWPGVLGNSQMEPPDWVNEGGLITLGGLIRTAEQRPQDLESVIAGAPNDVIGRLDALAGGADMAIAALKGASPRSAPEASAELQALIASAEIAHSFALEMAATLRARIAWHIVKVHGDDRVAASARAIADEQYEKAVAALRKQVGWALTLCSQYPDYLCHVVDSRETFYRFPYATRLKIREEELRRIRSCARPIAEDAMTIDI
jgi:hypothetical protein